MIPILWNQPVLLDYEDELLFLGFSLQKQRGPAHKAPVHMGIFLWDHWFSSLSTAHSRRFEIRASSCQTCSGDLGMCLGWKSRRKTFGRLCFGNTSELHSCPSTSFYIICWFGKNILTICLRHQESNTQLCCKDFWWRNFLLITTAAPRKENEEKSSLGFYFTG